MTGEHPVTYFKFTPFDVLTSEHVKYVPKLVNVESSFSFCTGFPSHVCADR